MKPPRLARSLSLEARTDAPDGSGGIVETWQELGRLWAGIDVVSGRERRDAGHTMSTVSYRVTVRSAPPGAPSRPQPDQRFREGGRIFSIRAVADRDPDGRYLTCYCDEEVSA